MTPVKPLSIIVPVYNVERYIGKCIDSLIQTEGIEQTTIILVDDGSTDDSGKIADAYASTYDYILCYHKTNGGLSDARNYGVLRAESRYVCFVDSDDMVIPAAMKEVIDISTVSEEDILLWDGQVIDDNDDVIKSRYDIFLIHTGLPTNGMTISGTNALTTQIEDHRYYSMMAWLGAFKRDYLLNNSLFFEKGLIHEDELWTPYVYINATKVRYIPLKVYCYRDRSDSLSGSAVSNEKHCRAYVYIMDRLFKLFSSSVSDARSRRLLLSVWAENYLWVIHAHDIYMYKCRKEIPRSKLLKYSKGIKTKIRSLVLLIFGISTYCHLSRLLVRVDSRK